MKAINLLAAAISAAMFYAGTATAAIEDPYKDDETNSPWSMSMREVTTPTGQVISGGSALASGGVAGGFDSYSPYLSDGVSVVEGYGSTEVGVGCSGINLGGIVDGQMNQYGHMVEAFIQNAPALAIMYLAYSQPVVKAVIDEMNSVGQFGLDLSNMTCSGVRALADKSAEEKVQAMAEAQCTAEAGFKDPECMSDEGILGNMTNVMREAKRSTNERAGAILGKANESTGGLIKFRAGIDGNAVSNRSRSSTAPGDASTGFSPENRTERCDEVKGEGLRTLLLASSGMSCGDIADYATLLPDYQISNEGIGGVIPRTKTLRQLSSEMVAQYELWLHEIIDAKEADYLETDAFKAVYNRTLTSVSISQKRALKGMLDNQPATGLLAVRNLAQLIAIKDLTTIVNKLEVGVLTGIQNQPDDQLISDLRKKQFLHAVDTLNSELSAIKQEVDMDRVRTQLGTRRG
jgi:hypothetical protein